MSQGNTFKYLRYAIGEIALVVIGILIALQINNWNLERLDRRQEVKILTQLQADLRQNRLEIAGLLDFHSHRLRACDSIHSYWQDRRAQDDSLRLYLELVSQDQLFNSAQTTYDYIKNQGTNFLTNDSLRDKIILMFEREFENIFKREDLSWRMILDEMRPVFSRQLRSDVAIENPDYLLVNQAKDIDRMWDDDPFINAITNMRWLLWIRTNELPRTLQKLENLQEEIDAEISRLSSN